MFCLPHRNHLGRAFNATRQVCLASQLSLANTHLGRLRGLLGISPETFGNGSGLWIVPCHGVHSLGMSFPIDVVYLDRGRTVVHIEQELRPWKFAPVKISASSVLELPSKTIAQTGTNLGDKIEITF